MSADDQSGHRYSQLSVMDRQPARLGYQATANGILKTRENTQCKQRENIVHGVRVKTPINLGRPIINRDWLDTGSGSC